MKISTHFNDYEFVSKDFYEYATKQGRSIEQIIDSSLIAILEWIREYFKQPVKINDWKWGGSLNYRGFRASMPILDEVGIMQSQGFKTNYFSQHCYGRAADITVSGINSQEVLKVIQKKRFTGAAGCITDNSLHIDARNSKELIIIKY